MPRSARPPRRSVPGSSPPDPSISLWRCWWPSPLGRAIRQIRGGTAGRGRAGDAADRGAGDVLVVADRDFERVPSPRRPSGDCDMTALLYLIPAALFLGLVGLVAFAWALRSGQQTISKARRTASSSTI